MEESAQVQQVMSLFREIATLQKKELVSTVTMTNYNASYTQLIQLKGLCQKGANPQILRGRIEELLTNTFAEMADEFQQMIDPIQIERAGELYNEMKVILSTLMLNLSYDENSVKPRIM